MGDDRGNISAVIGAEAVDRAGVDAADSTLSRLGTETLSKLLDSDRR